TSSTRDWSSDVCSSDLCSCSLRHAVTTDRVRLRPGIWLLAGNRAPDGACCALFSDAAHLWRANVLRDPGPRSLLQVRGNRPPPRSEEHRVGTEGASSRS